MWACCYVTCSLSPDRKLDHTKALAYVPSTPNSWIGGRLSDAAGVAYPRKAVRGAVVRRAAASAGRNARAADIVVWLVRLAGR